jgi:hypothetical protein
MEITFLAIESESMTDALQWTDASGQGETALIGGEPMVVQQADLNRLEEAGVEFAYIFDHEMSDGSYRIVTVPVN